MFVPVSLRLGAGGQSTPLYDRAVETTVRQFAALERNAGNMTVPLGRVAQDLHTQIEMAFATEGSSGATGHWVALSEDYGTWKARHAPGAPLLVGLRPAAKGSRQKPTRPQSYTISGRMMEQLLVPLGDKATWRIGPKMATYTPVSNIAGFHQTGTDRMKARPPVDPTVAFLHSIDRTFVTWLNELVDATGL